MSIAKPKSPERRLWFGVYGIFAALILAVGGLSYWHVREHVIETLDERLESALRVQTAAIEQWIESERVAVRSWVEEPDIRQAVRELTDADGHRSADDEAARKRINRELTALLRYRQPLRYAVLRLDGEIMAASPDTLLQARLSPAGLALLQAALADGAVISMPMRSGSAIQNVDLAEKRPFILRLAPVNDDFGKPIAVLATVSAKDVFDDIFEAGEFGRTGETYAIDAEGRLVSSPRPVRALLDAGLLGQSMQDLGGFGWPVVSRPRPISTTVAKNDEDLPLSVSAQGALSRSPGRELDGYRDYRGQRVIGAWRWIDHLDIGLVAEIEESEAFRPLRPLIFATSGLFVIFVITAICLVVYFRRVMKLKGQLDSLSELGQYKLIELIGEGGMGKVFRARHALLARETAIKVLKPEIVSEDSLRRFEKEVRHTANLQHPNTIAIYDFGRTEGGLFYYAMEYIDGLDLGSIIRRHGAMPPGRVVHILKQACLSLREAHASGLLHRDIKPENIMLTVQGGIHDTVKVLDFGLVQEMAEDDPAEPGSRLIPGTPPYIAPERMRPGTRVDGRVDIYALGAVGFALLTGQPVFVGASSLEVAHKTLGEKPPRASMRAPQAIPPALDELIDKTLAPDAEGRPADIATMMAALDGIAAECTWTQSDAAAWWAHHRLPQRAATKDPRQAVADETMAIDLRKRTVGNA